jgi:hypothetical protein
VPQITNPQISLISWPSPHMGQLANLRHCDLHSQIFSGLKTNPQLYNFLFKNIHLKCSYSNVTPLKKNLAKQTLRRILGWFCHERAKKAPNI